MKITLIKTPTDETDKTVVTHEINGVLTVNELLDAYKDFLLACGYVLDINDDIVVYNPDGEA